MIRSLILLFIFAATQIQMHLIAAEQSPTSITVSLSTESKRIPLYLTHIKNEQSEFDLKYSSQLEEILRFDFENNGKTTLIPITQEKENLSLSKQANAPPPETNWKSIGTYYVIKTIIRNKSLSAYLFRAGETCSKGIENIPLTGDLSQDRRKIHKLADLLHKALFNVDGIASSRILFTEKSLQKDSTWKSDLFECDYDGANRRLLSKKESGYAITPTYMPPLPGLAPGSFFYVSYQTGQPKIYYQSLIDNTPPHRLSLIRGNQLMPTVSRNRDKIAFICDVTGNPDLFIQPFDPEKGPIGKPYQIFSSYLATQGTPTFSPDGSKIAFVSNKDGSPRIYTIEVPNPGTSLKNVKATLITKKNQESSAPAWSPDGTKLSYCATIKGIRQIWVYDFATGEEKQLTEGPGNKENPSWAPNSLHIVFNSTDHDACDLFFINLNQPTAIKITSGSHEKRFPCWQK